MTEIHWEEPPAHVLENRRGRGARGYTDFARELMEHPGKWAVLPNKSTSEKGAKTTAAGIRSGKISTFQAELEKVERDGGFDAVADGTKIYVCYQELVMEDEENGEEDSDDQG